MNNYQEFTAHSLSNFFKPSLNLARTRFKKIASITIKFNKLC
ncbi:hypothetical protein [uncultured Gammaproteobacteria bacterium]|nr:hypothetical protein [uncultured Gammaproteobacteria bacterium]